MIWPCLLRLISSGKLLKVALPLRIMKPSNGCQSKSNNPLTARIILRNPGFYTFCFLYLYDKPSFHRALLPFLLVAKGVRKLQPLFPYQRTKAGALKLFQTLQVIYIFCFARKFRTSAVSFCVRTSFKSHPLLLPTKRRLNWRHQSVH